MALLKIKSTHPESQGEFVLIDEENFNAEIHNIFGVEEVKEEVTPVDESVVEAKKSKGGNK